MKKISFRNAIKKLGGTEIKVSKGYHYQSAFFNIGEQLWYACTSDDRINIGTLVRTAKDRKDYTGGVNEYWFDSKLKDMGYYI